MATANNFTEYYKTISNTELLSILDKPGDYQPVAVEAAKKEFANRLLSDAQIREARQPLIAKQVQKQKEREKVKAVETKIKEAGYAFIDTIDPIQSGIPLKEKTIRLIVIIFSGIFLYEFIADFHTHLVYLRDIPRFPVVSSLYLFPLILLPVAIFTFWKRKPLGWTLLTIFLTFSAAGVILLLVQSFYWQPSDFPGLENLFPRPSATTYIVQLLFFIGTLIVLCRADIREVFSIGKQKMGVIIGVTGIVTFILLLMIS